MNYLSFDVGIKNLAYCVITPEKDIVDWGIINLNENPICDVILNKKCEKQATYIVKNDHKVKHCCTTHSKKFKDKKKMNTNHDLFLLSKICVNNLKKLDLSTVKTVLIENQPALKNPVMKSIQMIIYTFFVIEGVMNDQSSIEKIHMVNARNKLKVYQGPKIECNKKGKYAQNKYLSVEYTKIMIINQQEIFKKLFDSSKKKDDLADAYLQGIYWIEK
tara:strand:- start:419 stop:1072 length:654 start_codon:yes stop_codon:yes gene_type:complete